MTDVSTILSEVSHRPFELPIGQWKYYQEWNNALFLHWEISLDLLRKYVPEKLHIDSHEGKYYISLVAFTMQKIRPKNLPAVTFISDFHEINLRTYIDNDNKKGVYFLSIEAEKHLSAFIAKKLSGLPYEKSIIKRTNETYVSKNKIKGFTLDSEFEIKSKILHKSNLDKWLTERYCLYLDTKHGLLRYDVHHKEWELKNVIIKKLSLSYQIGEIIINKQPDLMHYSDGVKVIAWEKNKL
jgi:uncharacterized protein YqjF (DUF2071 family)